MTDYAVVIGAKRTALSDYFVTVGANVSRDTTIKKSGAASIKCTYGIGEPACEFSIGMPATLANYVVRFDYYFEAGLATAAAIWNDGNSVFYLNTDGTIRRNAGSSTSALSSATQHQIEILYDRNYDGTLSLRYILRVDGVVLLSETTGTAAVTSAAKFGNNIAKGNPSPTGATYYDNIYFWRSDTDAYGDRPPWINTQVCEVETADRVPIAVGNYSDFTASSGTNKYDLVDEVPSNSDTDYNSQVIGATAKRQTFTFTSVASYTNPVTGFTVFGIHKTESGTANGNAGQIMLRDNGVDYEFAANGFYRINGLITTYQPWHHGRPTRPDGTILTATALNSLEGGTYLRSDADTMTVRQTAVFLTVATGDNFTDNNPVTNPQPALVGLSGGII